MTRKLTKKTIEGFQKEILGWYSKNKRDLPWRHSRDPYSILISEVMLQQTQVSRVIPKFEAWMKQFPTLQSLAKASTRDILSLWSGLGYNRRALYLQKLAQEVVKNNKGIFSQEENGLKKLPGIGEYTARAILCFAFNKQVAVVDTNIRKVILTFLKGKEERGNRKELSEKEIQEIAEQLLPVGKAYEWNQALMDFAASELKNIKAPIKKQSKFQDSDRFFRGLILRILLKKHTMSLQNVLREIHRSQKLESERYKKIIQGLEKEGFLKRNKNMIIVL